MTQPPAALAGLLGGPGTFVAGGCHDPVSARIIEHVGGYNVLYVTGFGLAASRLGLPDMGFLDRSDFIDGLTRIRRVSRLPMLVDAEDGYGDAAAITWTFSELARIGVDGAHIEDLKDPLKYRDDVSAVSGNGKAVRTRASMQERQLLHDEGDMARRIAAARAGAGDRLVVIARSDSRAFGLQRTIERFNAYVDAGAHACMVAEPYPLPDLEELARAINAPLLCCVGVRQDLAAHTHSVPQLAAAGIRGALFTATTFFAGVHAMTEIASLVIAQGTLSQADMAAHLMPFEDFNDVLGADAWYRLSERLAGMQQ